MNLSKPAMTLTADPYAALGLEPDADEQAIRQAFRQLAHDLHPDHNPAPGAAEAFMRVREAYEALMDPALREAVEAEEVIAAASRAAAEAMQSRVRPSGTAPPVVIPLDGTRLGLPGLTATVAARVSIGLAASALLFLTVVGLIGIPAIVLGGVCAFSALAVWVTRRIPADLQLFADHFADGRWSGGHVGWADVRSLDADHTMGTLDLELTAAAADQLECDDALPSGVLLWQGRRPFYRLPLAAWLPDVLRLIESRTGLRAA